MNNEKGIDNNTNCLCLYGKGSDEDILNLGEQLINTKIIKDASVNNYIYYKTDLATENQIYSNTHKNVSNFKLEIKRDDYFIDSDNET